MQGKLFQKCTHLLYGSVLSLGGNVNKSVTAWHGIHLSHKKSMKYYGHRKLLCELSKLSKFNALNLLGYLTNTDASILVYKFRPKRTGFNFLRNVYTTAINFPCITFLVLIVVTLITVLSLCIVQYFF